MEQETIKINNIEYVRKDAIKETKGYWSNPRPFGFGDIKIVVLDRGFVYVGNVAESDDFLYMTNAKNIRVWGTTKGLGELVNGALSGTKLDYVGSLKIPARALISIIDVKQSAWE